MDSVKLKTKELLTYHCGCHGNLVTTVTKYVADAYRLMEPPYYIWTKELQSKMYLTQTQTQTQTHRLRLIDSLDS